MLRKSLSAFVLCLVATGAFAITYIVPTDRDMVKRADAIVVGAALTSYVQQNAQGGIETVTPFAIHEIIKGSNLGFTVDVHEPGGHFRNVYRVIPGVPRFQAGEEALIFLTRNQNGDWNVTDFALGRFVFRTDSLGHKFALRDAAEIVGPNADGTPHHEIQRDAAAFLDFVRTEAHGGAGQQNYTAAWSEALRVASNRVIAPNTTFTPTSYTEDAQDCPTTTSPLPCTTGEGARWNIFPGTAVSFLNDSTHTTAAPTTADAAAMTAWDNDAKSNVNYVYAGVDPCTGACKTGGLTGAADGTNTILWERNFGAPAITCTASSFPPGTLGIGGLTTASGTHTGPNGETFITASEVDVEMNVGLLACVGTSPFTQGDLNSAVAHEVGHTLGFRHSDQNRANNAATQPTCGGDASLECSASAIMTHFIPLGINAALQTWDQHAVRAVYPSPLVATGDFDKNGTSDLVLQTSTDDSISNWLMTNTAPTQGQQLGSPTGWSPVAIADLNGDGNADIILQNRTSGAVAAWIIGSSGAFVNGVYLIGSPGSNWKVRTTGDFNKDGKADLVLQDVNTGSVSVWLMDGATILLGQSVGANIGSEWVVQGTGDFDADGNVDIILQSTVSGNVVIWRMIGISIAAGSAQIAAPGTTWQVIAAGDFDGDGKSDVLLQNSATTQITVWIMNGTTITTGHVIATPGASWTCKGRGDFNGDGTADVVIQNSASKQVVVYLMSAGFVSTTGSPIAPASTYTLMTNH